MIFVLDKAECFSQIIGFSLSLAHFEAPIAANPTEFRRAFAFLEDDTLDAFPPNDLARGLKPIADLALGKK